MRTKQLNKYNMLKYIKSIKTRSFIIAFLILFYAVGVLGLSYPKTQNFFITLMPWSLLMGMGILAWRHRSWQPSHIWYFLGIAVFGFGIEVVGVLTGHIFGIYSYGSALGFKFPGTDTPPLIGLNWLMLIYCIYAMLRKLTIHPVLQVVFGAGLMVAYDILLEPVAMKLDMWDWAGGFVPLQNYIAWFVISIVMLSVLHIAKIRYRNGVATAMFFVQMGFFFALNLTLL